MDSIWKKMNHNPEKLAFSGHIQTEAAVIGGGMAGILTAFFLQEAGVKTILLEAGHIGEGQTGNTTAKITAQHGLLFDGLTASQGAQRAALYAKANQAGVEEYRRLVKQMDITCDWQDTFSCVYSTRDRELMENEALAAAALGLPAEFVTETELPFAVEGGVRLENCACFSPLDFLYTLAETLTIYENSEVKKVEEKVITTAGGEVTAEHIIFAGHFPFLNKPGYYFARMYQERSYCLALSGAGSMKGMYYGVEEEDFSFRGLSHKGREMVLMGGCNHRTGGNEGGRYDRLRAASRRFWPECAEAAAWSAQDCMTLDGIPYIGRYSSQTPEWYVATGFGKWGMSHSMVSALLLTD